MLAPTQSVARYDLAWSSHHHSSPWVSFAKERHRGIDAALHSVIEDPSEVPAPSEVETATTVALGSVFDATFEDVTKMIESFLEVWFSKLMFSVSRIAGQYFIKIESSCNTTITSCFLKAIYQSLGQSLHKALVGHDSSDINLSPSGQRGILA